VIVAPNDQSYVAATSSISVTVAAEAGPSLKQVTIALDNAVVSTLSFAQTDAVTRTLRTIPVPVAGQGKHTLVARATDNYERNRPAVPGRRALATTSFVARNLFEMTPAMLVADGAADKWLVDPPREGAFALAKALADLHQQVELHRGGWAPPKRIVYVSCNPSTLARDAGLLVHQAGYRCTFAGVVNMFPHTSHVESIAVFDLA